jgi:hypothetical protein
VTVTVSRLAELAATEKRLTDRITGIYREFHPEGSKTVSPEFREAKGRLSVTLNRVRAHRKLMIDRHNDNAHRSTLVARLASVRQAIDEGKTLLAFDIERSWRALTHATAPVEGRIVRVDDVTGFKPGHLLLVGKSEHILGAVNLDEENTSLRETGESGELILETKASVAVGTEITGLSATRELGFTTFKNGVMVSVNLRAEDAKKSHWIGFEFGDTQRVSVEEMTARLMAVAKDATFYIGHSLMIDIMHLREAGVYLPNLPILDTFELAGLVPHFAEDALDGANLSAVAAYFGVEAKAPHCGGNDARYNMEVLLAMVNAYVYDQG